MKILSIILFVALAAVAVCDLPVHCLYPTTKGDWDFHLTEQNLDKNTAASTCSYKKDISSFAKTYRVSLQVPNIAQDQAGNKGTWTLIYDQVRVSTYSHALGFRSHYWWQQILCILQLHCN